MTKPPPLLLAAALGAAITGLAPSILPASPATLSSDGTPPVDSKQPVPARVLPVAWRGTEKNAAAAKPTTQWPQWGGTGKRNNTPVGVNIPTEWEIGDFDRQTSQWLGKNAKNIKWVARLGGQSYGNPVVAGGQIYVGTNNEAGYLPRYPSSTDLGCLLAFRQSDGQFLWQHSSEKLPTGSVHDWPMQGICCAPLVEGNRLWFVSSRGEVVCLDTEGFYDDQDDGPVTGQWQRWHDKREADTVWTFNMMKQLGTSQHNMCSCSVTAWGDILFVNTSNGVDETHIKIPAPDAPSFVALDKKTGKVLWTDNSPGANILHGQWSSPAVGVLAGVPQVVFGAGDGWVYSFRADAGSHGRPQLLWKFDANPKTSKWMVGGRGTRSSIIATPVLYDNRVFVAVGQDPEHGEGDGHLWCIDPSKRGDVSPQLAMKQEGNRRVPIPPRRLQAVNQEQGEVAVDNPNSAAVWHYSRYDQNGDGKFDFEEVMHRSCGTVAIKDDILYIGDFSGLLHCLDARTGKAYWTYDLLAAVWGSPLIVDGKVYIGDEDGDVCVFRHTTERHEPLAENYMNQSVYSTPIVAANVLYISSRTHLFAIESSGE